MIGSRDCHNLLSCGFVTWLMQSPSCSGAVKNMVSFILEASCSVLLGCFQSLASFCLCTQLAVSAESQLQGSRAGPCICD